LAGKVAFHVAPLKLTFLLTAKCIARVYFRNSLNIVIQTQPDVHLSGSGLRRLL
jgi:hypothetical protein